MTSNAEKTGSLFLHGGERGIAFRDTKAGRINTVVTPHYRHEHDYTSQTSATANNANGVYLGRSFSYNANYGTPYVAITLQGYIQSGTYYWSWALWNGTQSHFVPIAASSITNYSASAKTRSITTIQGTQSMNCVVPYRGGVHNMSSQPWVTFDLRNENHGDALYIYGAADGGSGGQWYAGTQTIYIKEVLIGFGVVTGMQYDHILHG